MPESVRHRVMRQTERNAARLGAHIGGLLSGRLWRVVRNLMQQPGALDAFARVIRQPWAIRVFK